MKRLKSRIHRDDLAMDGYEKLLTTKNDEISKGKLEIANLNRQIHALNKKIDALDSQVLKLEFDLDFGPCVDEIAQYTEKIKKLERDIESIQRKLDDNLARQAVMRKDASTQTEIIGNLITTTTLDDRLKIQMRRNSTILQNKIAPTIVSEPIDTGKMFLIGLFRSKVTGEYYLMRRQLNSWSCAVDALMRQKMEFLFVWYNVPNAIALGNKIKKYGRIKMLWNTRGNRIFLRANVKLNTKQIINLIDNIITEKNAAHKLADENENLISS